MLPFVSKGSAAHKRQYWAFLHPMFPGCSPHLIFAPEEMDQKGGDRSRNNWVQGQGLGLQQEESPGPRVSSLSNEPRDGGAGEEMRPKRCLTALYPLSLSRGPSPLPRWGKLAFQKLFALQKQQCPRRQTCFPLTTTQGENADVLVPSSTALTHQTPLPSQS